MYRRRLLIGCLVSWLTAGAVADDIGRTSFEPLHRKAWDYDRAAHLLRRAGFGGTPEQVQALEDMGLEAAVDSLVDYKAIKWNVAPPMTDPLLLEPPPTRDEIRALSEDERRALGAVRRKAQRRTFEEARLWWIDRMVQSPRPFEEKMTLFWHGHFTSGMREVRNPIFMREQNDLFRANAVGNYRDLLVGISKDRAMLVYLDNNRNVKRKPNENYGRELMELFTLGIGHYTEYDIKAAARAFTGWAFDRDGFQFRPRLHDYGKKKFLGRVGRWNGLDIIDIIMDQPACSQFLARKLLEFFCQPDPPRAAVNRFAGIIRKNKFELKPAMKALFMSKMFYHESSRGSLIKSPVELLVGAARQLGVPINSLPQAERAMAAMGQEIMQPPNVKGWDGGPKWINTATLFNRYNFVGGLVYGGGQRPKRDRARRRTDGEQNDETSSRESDDRSMAMRMSMTPRSRLVKRPQPAYDPIADLTRDHVEGAAQIVDYYAARLLAVPLAAGKRAQLVEFLTSDDGRGRRKSDRRAGRLRTMIHLMMSTPEFQMN